MKMVYNKKLIYNLNDKESYKRVSFEDAEKMIESGEWVAKPVFELSEEPIKKKRVRRTKAQIEADKQEALEDGNG
jgi:hypothetical protein